MPCFSSGTEPERSRSQPLATCGHPAVSGIRRLPLPGIRPYATAGAGIKWYDFNQDGQGVYALLNDQERFTFNIGAGILLMPNSPMGIVIEANDYMSRFEFESGEKSDTQHDLFLKIGLSFGMGGAGS